MLTAIVLSDVSKPAESTPACYRKPVIQPPAFIALPLTREQENRRLQRASASCAGENQNSKASAYHALVRLRSTG
jgi:hypothetical protein